MQNAYLVLSLAEIKKLAKLANQTAKTNGGNSTTCFVLEAPLSGLVSTDGSHQLASHSVTLRQAGTNTAQKI
jgi:hypothetical protein